MKKDTDFECVLYSVYEWLYGIKIKYAEQLMIEIIKEDQDSLTVNFDTKQYIAELNCSKPDFRPYRFVKFCVLDIEKDTTQQPAFVYYDDDNASIIDIINNLI